LHPRARELRELAFTAATLATFVLIGRLVFRLRLQ
jgi:hypothetical protein